MDTLFRGATIITDGLEISADLAVKNGKVSQLGSDLEPDSYTRIVEAEGMFLFPGAVEFLAEIEEFSEGERAEGVPFVTGLAAAGGVTTLVVPAPSQPGEDLASTVENLRALVANHSFVDYGFHLVVRDWSDDTRRKLRSLERCALSSVWLLPPAANGSKETLEGLLWAVCRELGDKALVVAPLWDEMIARQLASPSGNGAASGEPESPARGSAASAPALFPAWAEAVVVERLATLATAAGGRSMLRPVSSRRALESLQQRREKGAKTLACASLIHLCASVDTALEDGAESGVASWPPVRGKSDQAMLWWMIEEGLLPVVTSSCGLPGTRGPFARPAAARHPGEGLALLWPLLFTEGVMKNRVSLPALVEAVSSSPAKLAGLYPAKGSLLIGADADIVVYDPRVSWTIGGAREKPDEDMDTPADPPPEGPFVGRSLQGAVVQVYLRGKKAIDQGIMTVEPGEGRFVERKLQL